MEFKVLDTVVLAAELPEHRLTRGDLGAVVAVHGPNALEVEFVRASGDTIAVVTVKPDQIRAISGSDVIAVRPAIL
jgi:Domain of unknown function (DUF4926)